LGSGLQKLAANYVSGFVILAERSMRIGDNVRVDNFEGRITDINARYTLIRALTGRESIVPNEMLITNRVENLSLADSKVWQSTVVSVGYDSDVALVGRLLDRGCALAWSASCVTRPQCARCRPFGADGLEFTLGFTGSPTPENGQLNVRSDDQRQAILKALRAARHRDPVPAARDAPAGRA
jgi:small-conductance mechanosensitive channel